MGKTLDCRSSETVSKCAKIDEEFEEEEEQEQAEEIHRHADLLPHEIALSFDHILEQIFRSLDTTDLLNCRLVSRRFLKFTQVPLGKKLKLTFSDYKLEIRVRGEVCRVRKSSEKTLDRLTEFLKQWKTSSAAENAHVISFPCNCFCFFYAQLGDDVLQNFLNINGPHIRKLTVFRGFYEDDTHENILMDQISLLLTSQAPNLEHLQLERLNPIVEWQEEVPLEILDSINENSPIRSNRSPLLKTDPEFQEIISRAKSVSNKSSLKFIEIGWEGLAKVLELIIRISPKLQEVIMNEKSYMSLMQPVNRVHLVKRVEFKPKIDENCSMDSMENFSKDNNLALKKLLVGFDRVLAMCKTNLEFEKRLVSITNITLEKSKDTLTSLSLFSTSYLRGMKIPSPMNQVRKLKIYEYYEDKDSVQKKKTKVTAFPTGFSFPKAFPKLTFVKLFHYSEFIELNEFFEFINCLDFQEGDDPILSLTVNKVVLSSPCFCTRDGLKILPAFISERVREFFPNAQIEVETYYSAFRSMYM